MGTENGKTVTIDAAVAQFHGDRNGFGFADTKGKFYDEFTIDDIKSLDPKSMEYFISFSCNTGDQRWGDNNFSTQIMIQQPGIKYGIGADGSINVSYYYIERTTGFWFWKKTIYEPHTTITTEETWYRKGETFAGQKLYSRDDEGKLKFYTPIGGFGYVFDGITELLDSAKVVQPTP